VLVGFGLTVALSVLALFAGIVVLMEAGRRWGVRRRARDPHSLSGGVGPIEGAVFALMGLLIAFTFYGAAERFDGRRTLSIDEANALGTAYLRLDMLPPDARDALRERFVRYVDQRLAFYRDLHDREAAMRHMAATEALQVEIWARSVDAAAATEGPAASVVLLPALNQMFDIANTRRAILKRHPPLGVFLLLGLMILTGAFMAGLVMSASARSTLHVLAFAFTMSVTVYFILDYEYPRSGLVRVDATDQLLRDVRASMR
jgi:hypothetical protein